MCARCQAESADYAAKAEAAYAANGWRLRAALTHEEELVESVRQRLQFVRDTGATGASLTDTARAVIDAVRAFDEQTALMREAATDHQAQNNETEDGHDYY